MYRILTAAILILAFGSTASAGETKSKSKDFFCAWPHQIAKYCCDDYQPKCAPCVNPVCNFVCDDYCRKCAPCVKPICNLTCDDYCRKCPPTLGCPNPNVRCPLPIKCQTFK